jgi:hypothetical protein
MNAVKLESLRVLDPDDESIEEFTGYRNADGEFVKHGSFRGMLGNGVVVAHGEFEHGFRHGTWREYHENGSRLTEGLYKNGSEDGVHRTWFGNGNLRREVTFADGLAQGPRNLFYESGQLREACHYENDVRTGECKAWDEEGRLLAEGIYRDDSPWEGTFVVQPPMEPAEELPTFNDYMDRFLNRGFVVAAFQDGQEVAVIEDHTVPFVPPERPPEKTVDSQEAALCEGIDAVATLADADPETAWKFALTIYAYPDDDIQQRVADQLLDPLISQHLALYRERIERRLDHDKEFGRVLLKCAQLDGLEDLPSSDARASLRAAALRRLARP